MVFTSTDNIEFDGAPLIKLTTDKNVRYQIDGHTEIFDSPQMAADKYHALTSDSRDVTNSDETTDATHGNSEGSNGS